MNTCLPFSAVFSAFLMFSFSGCEGSSLSVRASTPGSGTQSNVQTHTGGAAAVTTGSTHASTARVPGALLGSPSKLTPPLVTEAPTSDSEPNHCTELLSTPPRGLACLHCMQPEAQTQAGELINLLRDSCLKNPSMNFLLDGSFSKNKTILFNVIDTLSADDRHLHLHLYFLNGPSQRRKRNAPGPTLSTQYTPREFRRLIMRDEGVQNAYQELIAEYVPILKYAMKRGVSLTIVPMLEDNLTDTSFNILRRLTEEAIPESVDYRLGRSSCGGCYPGNQSGVPKGVFEEDHSGTLNFSFEDGMITNDGVPISPTDVNASNKDHATTLAELSAVMKKAGKLGNIFLLWSAARQGLGVGSNGSLQRVAPQNRQYALPDVSEKEEVINFLRESP